MEKEGREKEGGKKDNITLAIINWRNCDVNKNKQEILGALRTVVFNSLIRKYTHTPLVHTNTRKHTQTQTSHSHTLKNSLTGTQVKTTDETLCNSKHCTEMVIWLSYGCV